jgi:hypothetical protein
MAEQDERIYLNGIDAVTGQYMVDPMSSSEAVAMARGKPQDSAIAGWVKRVWETMQRPFMGLPLDVEATDVSQAGWARFLHPTLRRKCATPFSR